MRRRVLTATALAGCALVVLSAAESTPAVYTAAQAEAGRTAYRSTCGKCHTETLLGRKGDAGELPPVDSLPPGMREVVQSAGGIVPPLAGADFLDVWGSRTTKEFSARVQVAVGGFPPEGKDKETYLHLTAYFLQASGARAGSQPLTASTAVEIRTITTK